MSTLRLSRYSENEYYYELWAEGRRVWERGEVACGDFAIDDLPSFVDSYPDLHLVMVCEPDQLNRQSDLRTRANACPTGTESFRFQAAIEELEPARRPGFVIAVEAYYRS